MISENYELFYPRFLESDLGKIYQSIPWGNLVSAFELKEKHLGRKSLFSLKGRIALIFLKNYTEVSDRKLIEQLNGNLDYQFFCDINLGVTVWGMSSRGIKKQTLNFSTALSQNLFSIAKLNKKSKLK